ncbi:MAG: glycosyltransferase family 4 protein [candidate division NC10 bacterium]|nr:glycosyltransferase family 4 protein [candidate division NC10 bacterium]
MKICFVSLYAYPLFNSSLKSPFGGSEVRSWLLGVGLSRFPEHEVSFVVFDHGQEEVEQFDRVKVYRHSYYKGEMGGQGSPLRLPSIDRLGRCVRLIQSRLGRWLGIADHDKIEPRKTQIYQVIDADIYCGFGVSNFTAEVAAFSRRFGKKFVLFAGSDQDLSSSYRPGSRELNLRGSRCDLCYYALMHADLIITQTETQRGLLSERFAREGVTLLSPIDLSENLPRDERGKRSGRIALWIGKSDQVKRPQKLLELALAFPEIQFVMVLNRSDPGIFEEILRERPSNVQVLEWIPLAEADRLFARAFVLINTSVYEGFPNTFLQAGKHGVPVLSLQVDPDGFIEKHSCGFVGKGNFDQFAKGLHRIYSDPNLRSRFGENIRRYVEEHHALEEKIEQLSHLLAALSSHE